MLPKPLLPPSRDVGREGTGADGVVGLTGTLGATGVLLEAETDVLLPEAWSEGLFSGKSANLRYSSSATVRIS